MPRTRGLSETYLAPVLGRTRDKNPLPTQGRPVGSTLPTEPSEEGRHAGNVRRRCNLEFIVDVGHHPVVHGGRFHQD